MGKMMEENKKNKKKNVDFCYYYICKHDLILDLHAALFLKYLECYSSMVNNIFILLQKSVSGKWSVGKEIVVNLSRGEFTAGI